MKASRLIKLLTDTIAQDADKEVDIRVVEDKSFGMIKHVPIEHLLHSNRNVVIVARIPARGK